MPHGARVCGDLGIGGSEKHQPLRDVKVVRYTSARCDSALTPLDLTPTSGGTPQNPGGILPAHAPCVIHLSVATVKVSLACGVIMFLGYTTVCE
jgi:hypothetical protein